MKTEQFRAELNAHGYYEAVPRPTQAELDAFYRDVYFNEATTTTYSMSYPESEMRHRRLRADVNVEAIRRHFAGNASLRFLEVGSGEGFLLAAAAHTGWDAHGVDYSSTAIERCNPSVLEWFTAAMPSDHLRQLHQAGEKFDVIALQNVVEHVLDPVVLLRSIRPLLTQAGILLIQVPNDFSGIQTLAKNSGRVDRDYWFAPPQHLNYFNKSSLAKFLHAQDFLIVSGYSDFPIEMYLWGCSSNYVRDAEHGKHAHAGRVALDLLMGEAGIANYLDLCRALYKCDMGRNLIVLVRPT